MNDQQIFSANSQQELVKFTIPLQPVSSESQLIPKEDSRIIFDVTPLPEVRPIEIITEEINQRKNLLEQNFIKIGLLLNESKKLFGKYGDWKNWLDKEVDLSQRTANRLMRIASEVSNSPALADLGLTKIDILLRIEESRRETFITKNNIKDLSVRELETLVKMQKIKTRPQKNKVTNTTIDSNLQKNLDFIRSYVDDFIFQLTDCNNNEISYELKTLFLEAIDSLDANTSN